MTRTQSNTLGPRLVAFRDIESCDRAVHEVAIITDGQRAYTYGIDPAGTEAGIVCRSGVQLTAVCQQPTTYAGDTCDGQVTWAIDTEGCWGADADALRLLTAYGHGVEQ